MRLSEINIYPVKSLRGIALNEALVEARGLGYDRRWVLIDATGRFLSQREHPKLSTIGVRVGDGSITFSSGERDLSAPLDPDGDTLDVSIWDDVCSAIAYDRPISDQLSEMLGIECRLVKMPESTLRPVDRDYAIDTADHVSFADGFPFLLIGQASLADLNRRLEVPVPMDRFRPNFVIDGSEPFAEDGWKRFRIGDSIFRGVKTCGRCVMTTIDQATGEKHPREPLATLAGYRTIERNGAKKVIFGQNLIVENPGSRIRVGDVVEILG